MIVKTKSLCEICLPKQWKTISTDMLTDEGYPVYGANGVIGFYPEYNHKEPTLLITCRGATCGALNICEPYSYVNGNAMALDNLTGEVDIKYLYYFLLNRGFDDVITGSAQPQIVRQSLQKVSVTYPELEKQAETVSTLEKISMLITMRKEQLAKLDQLVKSRFIELFGDGHDGKTPTKMLCSICKFQQGTQIPVEEQFEKQIAGYKRFLRIIDYTQAPQPPRYVSVNGKEVDEKSVVIVRYGATAGFVGRGYQGILANNLFEIIPDEKILSKDFLFLALKYGTFEEDVHTKAFGAAMPALSFSMMNDISVVVPVMEQQNAFVTFVKQTDKSKLTIQASLDKLEVMKKALMQEYFG